MTVSKFNMNERAFNIGLYFLPVSKQCFQCSRVVSVPQGYATLSAILPVCEQCFRCSPTCRCFAGLHDSKNRVRRSKKLNDLLPEGAFDVTPASTADVLPEVVSFVSCQASMISENVPCNKTKHMLIVY